MATTATYDDPVPSQGYDGLKGRGLIAHLRLRSQDELTRIESYERSNQARPAVLDKLRYLRNHEPIEGYDRLDADEVVAALAGADMPTLGAARSYEVKMRDRPQVLSGLAQLRRDQYALRGTSAAVDEPGETWTPDGPAGFLGGVVTVGILALIAAAALLLLALLCVLVFVILTAVAPETLRALS